jgi:eukaryotic-like serine/threonine-protein kinase
MSTARSCQQCGRLLRADDRFCPYCGTSQQELVEAPAEASQLSAWDSIFDKLAVATAPRYRILRLLGYGGMAGVYLAEEPRLGRQVAIKVMSPALLIDGAMLTRFQQEARTTAQLNHPNIVTIFDVDAAEGLQYFVMAYVPGRSLANVMSGRLDPLPVSAVLHWVSQIGAGLHHAHQLGVVHRDVKPANILFDGRGNALVTDFGIAKVADEPSLTRTGLLVGTPSYMSPEQCLAEQVTGASDQYSLGVLAYEMLAGRPPFTGQTVRVLSAHVHEPPPPLRDARPDCPPAIIDAIEKMLAKKPADRFPSVAAALSALGARPFDYSDPLLAEISPLTARVGRLEVRPPSELEVGQVAALETRVLSTTGQVLEGRQLTVRSDEPAVIGVTDAGKLRGTRAGEARVTVTCEGVAVRLSVKVAGGTSAVREPPTLEIVAPREALAAGESLALEARVPGQPTQQTGPIAWHTSDPAVAEVTSDGRVTGIHPGTVTVTASARGATASASFRITPTEELTAPGFGGVSAPPAQRTGDVDAPGAFEPPTDEPWRQETTGGAAAGEPPDERDTPAPTPAATLAPVPPTPPPHDPPTVLTAAPPVAEPPTPTPTPPPRTPVGGPKLARSAPVRPGGSRSTGGETPRRFPVVGAVLGVLVFATIIAAIVLRGGFGAAPGSDPTVPVTTPDAGDPTAGGQGDPAPLPPVAIDTPQAADSATTAAETPPVQAEDPPPATRPATPPATPPPAAPVEGRILLGRVLPAGATATIRGPDGRSWRLTGEPLALPPGRYTAEVRATGYRPVDDALEVRAGQTSMWTPTLSALPATPPPPPPPPPPVRDNPPPVDTAAERARTAQAVRARIDALAAAFETRNMESVVAVYPNAPAEWRQRWAALVENEQNVRDLRATVAQAGTAEIAGDVARIAFTLRLDYRDFRNAQQQATTQFNATLRRSGASWVISQIQ